MKILSHGVSVVLIILLVSALNASGEYYQYTDPNGNVRFTDDPSLIPPEQRETVQVYESFFNYPEDPEVLPNSAENPASLRPDTRSNERIGAVELIAVKKQLEKVRKTLEAAKRLGMPTLELNQKIEAYNHRCIELNEKVKVFNSRAMKT